ncbi:hypothetical protein P2318_00825 [Myxococcaceae bacterium GXIMD 01537]
MRFFRLSDDVNAPGRWHLTTPVDGQGKEVEDPWRFTEGHPVSVQGRLSLPVDIPGRALDFTLAGLSIPVAHVKVASILAALAPRDVQFIPVDIDGQPEQYVLLVATRLIPCIDEQASGVQVWGPEDGLPEKVGQYFSMRHLRIDPTTVGDARVFRARGWPGPLVVSDNIKDALERSGATGLTFTEV